MGILYPLRRDVRHRMPAERLGGMLAENVGNRLLGQFRPLLKNRIQRPPDLVGVRCIRHLKHHEWSDDFLGILLPGILGPRLARLLDFAGGPAYQHRVELAHSIGDIQDDRILQQARLLHLGGINNDIAEKIAPLRLGHGGIEPFHCGGYAQNNRDRRYSAHSVDEPLDDGGFIPLHRLRRGAHPPVRLVEHQVQRQVWVFNGVLDRIPDGVGTEVRPHFREGRLCSSGSKPRTRRLFLPSFWVLRK